MNKDSFYSTDQYIRPYWPRPEFLPGLEDQEKILYGRLFAFTKGGTKPFCIYSDQQALNELEWQKDKLLKWLKRLKAKNLIDFYPCFNRKTRKWERRVEVFNPLLGGQKNTIVDGKQPLTVDDCQPSGLTETDQEGGQEATQRVDGKQPPIYKEEKDISKNKERIKTDSSFSDFPKSYFLKDCSLDELADICQKYQDDCYKVLAKSLLVDHEFYWPEKDRDCKFERDGSDLEQVIAKDINPLTYLLLEQKYPESDISKPIVEKIGAAWNDTGTNHIKSFFDGWLTKEIKGLEFAHRADFKGEVFERVNQYIADNVSPVFYGHPVTVYRDSIDKVPEIYTLKGNIQYLRYVVNAYMYIAYNCNPIRYDFGNADAFYAKRTEENIDAIKRICREDFGRELSLDEIR